MDLPIYCVIVYEEVGEGGLQQECSDVVPIYCVIVYEEVGEGGLQQECSDVVPISWVNHVEGYFTWPPNNYSNTYVKQLQRNADKPSEEWQKLPLKLTRQDRGVKAYGKMKTFYMVCSRV